MLYAGLNEVSWRRLLGHDDVAVRLFAMRVMSQHGELGAAILRAHQPTGGQTLFPWIWAMARCAGPDLAGEGPLAMARYLARKTRRTRRGPSRSACADAIVAAVHPQKMLACATRLLELYGADAIQPLLDVIRYTPVTEGVVTRDYVNEKAACAAWALGQLGRCAVPEITQAYGKGSERCRAHLALALWYLGPDAERALPVLLEDPSEQAAAAMLAMESAAGTALVERGRGPIWLDDANLCALASYVYGEEKHLYAALALCCFGPASHKALPLLSSLAGDSDPEVRRMLAYGLGWGGRADVRPVLLLLLEDENSGVRNLARTALVALYQTESRESLLEALVAGPDAEKDLVAIALAERKLARTPELAGLLQGAGPSVAVTLLKALAEPVLDDCFRESLLELLRASRSAEVRLWAARSLRYLVSLPPLLVPIIILLKFEPDPCVAEELLRVLALSGAPLEGLPLPESLAYLPMDAVVRLIGAFDVQVSDLIKWLVLPDTAARKMAARALALLGPDTPEVIAALRAAVDDPENEVVVACARGLYCRGVFEESWRLLGSNDEDDRETAAAHLLDVEVLPPDFLAALSNGDLPISRQVLRVVTGSPRPGEVVCLLADILPTVAGRRPPAETMELVRELGRMGLFALDVLPELIGSRVASVRDYGLRALEIALRNHYEPIRNWVAQHAMMFPLDHPDEATRNRLHDALSDFLLQAKAWEDPDLKPLLRTLLGSTDHSTVARTIRCLAMMDDVAVELAPILDHPTPGIRLGAIWAIGRALPRDPAARRELAGRLLARPRESDDEVRLHQRSLLFRLDALVHEDLLDAFRDLAAGVVSPSGLFLPERCAQLRSLARLLFVTDPAVADLARFKLLAYPGELEPEDRFELVRVLRDPRCEGRIHVLVNRWPELVPLALMEEGDWTDLPPWIVDLSEAAEPGLVDGLGSPDPKVRLACLDVTRGLGTVGSVLLLTVGNRQLDPDPEVAERAHDTVRRISLRLRPP